MLCWLSGTGLENWLASNGSSAAATERDGKLGCSFTIRCTRPCSGSISRTKDMAITYPRILPVIQSTAFDLKMLCGVDLDQPGSDVILWAG
jgi:hypothetical protein